MSDKLTGLKELTVFVGWQLISSHAAFMSTRFSMVSLGGHACPAGASSICSGDVLVGVGLLVSCFCSSPKKTKW